MRNVNFNNNTDIEKHILGKYNVSNNSMFQVVAHDSIVFTNFRCNDDFNRHILNTILAKDAVHFIYPGCEEIEITINNDHFKSVICPANKTTVFSSIGVLKDDFKLKGKQGQEVSILSINCSILASYGETSITKFLNTYYESEMGYKICVQTFSDDEKTPVTIDKIKKFWNSEKSSNLFVRAAVAELQYNFIQNYLVLNSDNILTNLELQKISELPTIIKDQSENNLTEQKLASYLSINVDKMALGCKIVFKCDIISLINEIKLEKVALSLVKTKKTIAKIAYENGYLKRSHFYDVFLGRYKCSPLEYRTNSKFSI